MDGGPEAGGKVAPGVMIAGVGRVAVDAVGVALLRLSVTTRAVSAGRGFAQAQMAPAVELGLWVSRPELIHRVTDDRAGQDLAARILPALTA